MPAESQPGDAVRPSRSYRFAGLVAVILAGGAGVAAGRPGGLTALPGLSGGSAPSASTGATSAVSTDAAGPASPATEPRGHAFYFTRAIYTDWRGSLRNPAWATDYPKADEQFVAVLRRLTNLDVYASEHAVALSAPELRRYPFLYMLEVGYMSLRTEEVEGLRDYLLAGGFLFVDDFWGSREWANFESEMRRVLPEHAIVELPLEHAIFRSFYEIREILQVPAIGNWRRGGRTWEQDGYEPAVRGIFDEDGRLMVMINWNTDLGDAWEWAEQPDYPLRFSTFAFQVGVNAIVHAMTN
jgi:hypothetical protein